MTPVRRSRRDHPRSPQVRRAALDRGFILVARLAARLSRRFARIDVAPLPVDLRGCVMVANHTSLFDIFLSFTALSEWNRAAHFLVRARYVRAPVLGAVLRWAGAIPVRDPRAPGAGFTLAAEAMATGEIIAIMPEGKLATAADRAADGIGPFYAGVGKLLAEAHAPVMIAFVDGAEQVWPQGRPLPRLTLRRRPTITVRVRVVHIDRAVERDADELTALLRAAMVALSRGEPSPTGLSDHPSPSNPSSCTTSSGEATIR